MKINYLSFAFLLFCFLSGNHLAQAQTGVKVNVKVYLQGALIGNASGAAPLMRDDLRGKGLLPVNEPYAGRFRYHHVGPSGAGTYAKPVVFMATGANAIVDWVFLELRNADAPTEVLATRSALLQRDGDVVDVDGISAVNFKQVEAGEYFLAVRHRNHLGIMTAEAVGLAETSSFIDFTSPAEPAFGGHAQVPMGEVMAMWAGDVNGDGISIYQGPGNDIFQLFSKVLSVPENINYSANFVIHAYTTADINLDGKAVYNGPNSDRGNYFIEIMGKVYQILGPNSGESEILKENLP